MIQVLVALFKALPAIKSLVDQFTELWIYSQEIKDENKTLQKQKQREVLLKSLQNKELTNDERANLRRLLYDINKL